MAWYSHLFKNCPQNLKKKKNCPQFLAMHTVKGFGIVNEAEVDVEYIKYLEYIKAVKHLPSFTHLFPPLTPLSTCFFCFKIFYCV